MVSLDVVYLSMNRNRSYASVTLRHMEDTTLEIELHIRYCNPVFYWPTLFKDARKFVLSCDECQRIGNISRRQEMPMNYSLVIEPFDIWGFDYMGPFPASNGYTHILVAVDYVTKWVEAISTSSVDHNSSIKMLKEVIFPRFGVPRYLMTNGGSHFIHGAFHKMLAKYDMLIIELHLLITRSIVVR